MKRRVAGTQNGFHDPDSGPDLRWYLGVLWRRKLVILPLVVLLPLTTYLLMKPGPTTYEASATVLLNRQSQGASEIGDPTLWDPARTIRTQSEIARLPEVASRVIEESGLRDRDAGSFLATSSVIADEENDFLVFHARDAAPSVAVRLANLYAAKYIEFRRELDTAALREAARELTDQLEQLRRQGVEPDSQAYQTLISRRQQLETAETLQSSKALLVRPAAAAGQVVSGERRSVWLALGLGLILGLGLAFLIETLDTRVRSVNDLVRRLGLPLLGTIPRPSRSVRRDRRLVMIHEPDNPAAEPYRMLRASLEMSRPSDHRAIMVTSAVEAEGKSTTAANLAVAMARAGQHVALVDLDLYRPGLERWFRLPPRPGLTDVALGKVPLSDALREVPLASHVGGRVLGDSVLVSQNGRASSGKLEILPRGTPPESPGEFIATRGFESALEELRARADVLIVDGPPLLLSGDGLMLSMKLDGMLVIARVNVLKQGQVDELERILASCPATKLGLVVTGTPAQGGSYYYYRYHGRERAEPQRELAE